MKNGNSTGYRLVATSVPQIPGLRGVNERPFWDLGRVFATPAEAWSSLLVLLETPLGRDVADPHGRTRFKVLAADAAPEVPDLINPTFLAFVDGVR